ncbi:MAG: DUF4332 domain-containing protein [Candidatus Nanoarchaeia archaeon]|nr:DUF4332 domain-containing protein [Candidatus Nanoarchaeia archaeon]
MKTKNKLSNLIMYCMVLTILLISTVFVSAVQLPVDLGTAGDYVVLTKTGITTTGLTSIVGDIATSPIDSTAITGFGLILDSSGEFSTSSLVTGKIFAANYAEPTPTKLTTAVSDMETAYTDAAGRTLPDYTELYAGDITGKTLTPGLYKWGTDVLISASGVTISGSPYDVWIFQIAGDLTVANDAIITLDGGAQAANIFWQVGGVTGAILGTNSDFKGTILTAKGIVIQTDAVINVHALSQTAATLDGNSVTQSVLLVDTTPPVITVLGNLSVNVTLNDVYVDEGATALDDFDGDITSSIVTINLVNTSIAGTYLVKYDVSDTAGNVAVQKNRTVNVLAEDSVLTRIELSPISVNLTVGETQQMNATAFDQYDFEMDVEINYNSSNTSVATISTTGLVTALNAGIIIINASNGDISNISTIMVEEPVLTTFTLLPASAGITVNNTLQMSVTALDQFGYVMDVEINYTSSNDSVATINSTGFVNAIKEGLTTITATSGVLNDTSAITVEIATFTAIELLPETVNMTIMNSLQLDAKAVDQFGYVMDEEINYTSSDELIATVNFTTGLVNAISIGSATITATSGTIFNTSIINVVNTTAPVITSFTLNPTSVYVGETITGTCIIADNLDMGIITSITGIDTSSTGTKTATCTATGTTNLTDSATATYEVSSSSGGSSGGSGSGSYNYVPSSSEEKLFMDMPEGTYYLVFTNEGIVINQIELKTNRDASNVRIAITQLLGKPAEIPTPNLEKIYVYLEMDHINLDNSAIDYAKMKFKVDKQWMIDNDVDAYQINMYRYTSNWDLLNTKVVGQTSTHYYFESDSPGLSYFVIGTPFEPIVITPIIVPVTEIPVEDEGIISDTKNLITGMVTNVGEKGTLFWGLLLVFLLIGIIVAALLIPPKKKKKVHSEYNYYSEHLSPFSDGSVHEVNELQGIGPKYNKELVAMGIVNTEQLWNANSNKIANKTSVSTSTVESWQNMAELSCIKDIGPQYSELLERSGVHSIKQLKNYDVKSLLKLVTKKEDSLKNNIQGNTPGLALVSNWIEQAKSHKFVHKK